MSDLPAPGDDGSALVALEKDIREQIGFTNAALVVGEIAKVSAQIPSSVTHLPSSRARELAGVFLKGMDMCGELCAIATAYEMKMDLLKKKEHAEAMVIRSNKFGCKTVKEKEAYADIDEGYIQAAEKYIRAKMFRTIVDNKREDFEKAHYLMRKVADSEIIGGHSDSPTDQENSSAKSSDPDEAGWDSFSISFKKKGWE